MVVRYSLGAFPVLLVLWMLRSFRCLVVIVECSSEVFLVDSGWVDSVGPFAVSTFVIAFAVTEVSTSFATIDLFLC